MAVRTPPLRSAGISCWLRALGDHDLDRVAIEQPGACRCVAHDCAEGDGLAVAGDEPPHEIRVSRMAAAASFSVNPTRRGTVVGWRPCEMTILTIDADFARCPARGTLRDDPAGGNAPAVDSPGHLRGEPRAGDGGFGGGDLETDDQRNRVAIPQKGAPPPRRRRPPRSRPRAGPGAKEATDVFVCCAWPRPTAPGLRQDPAHTWKWRRRRRRRRRCRHPGRGGLPQWRRWRALGPWWGGHRRNSDLWRRHCGPSRKTEALGRVLVRREHLRGQGEIGPVERQRLGRIELFGEHLELERECRRVQAGQGFRDGSLGQHRGQGPELSGRREHGSHRAIKVATVVSPAKGTRPVTDSYRLSASE